MSVNLFGTALNCIDGRAQQPVADWLKLNFQVRYVDAINEPAMVKVLTQGPTESIAAIKDRATISVQAHQSRVIAVAGHHDCARNPVSREEHATQIARAVEVVTAWGWPVQVVGLWVNEFGWIDVIRPA